MYKLATAIVVALGTVGFLSSSASALPDCPGGGTRKCTIKCTGLFPPVCVETEPCTCAITGGGTKAQQSQIRQPGNKGVLSGGGLTNDLKTSPPRGPLAPPSVGFKTVPPSGPSGPTIFKDGRR